MFLDANKYDLIDDFLVSGVYFSCVLCFFLSRSEH